MQKKEFQKIILDFLFILIGSFIYAVGLDVFIVPNQLISGGLTGFATQLNYLFDLPIGVLVLIMNIPLLIFGWFKLGNKFVISTAFATVMSSILIDVVKIWVPMYHGNKLLVALFGGALTGLGISLLYLRGSSLGGSDIISTFLNKNFPHLPLGKISLVLNAAVIVSSMFVYRNIESALCSAVGAYVSSKVIDSVLVGIDSGNILLTVTDKPYEIAEEIHRVVGRGATVLPATGTYAGDDKYLLLCVARRHEFSKIKRVIKIKDPKSFVVVSDAREILGNGFKNLI